MPQLSIARLWNGGSMRNRKKAVIVLIMIVLSVCQCMEFAGKEFISKAAVSVSDLNELKTALSSTKKLTIVIKKNISIRETLVTKGEKIIRSGGGILKRAIAKNSAFCGTLIRVNGGSLSLRGIKIDGGGNNNNLKNKLYGRLVEVRGGQLSIRDGTELTSNVNTTKASDGGGAVCVRSGGVFAMYGGSISSNASVSSGAGVKVEKGGVFYMKGGSISSNRVVGRSNVAGFDGQGGGIYNAGSAVLSGGSIYSNSSDGYVKGTTTYGGIGGGVCNRGACLVCGTRIYSNRAGIKGGGVSQAGGNLKLNNASVYANKATCGKDVAVITGQTVCDGSLRISEMWLAQGKSIKPGRCSSSSKVKVFLQYYKKNSTVFSAAPAGWKKVFMLGGDAYILKKYKLKKQGSKVIIALKTTKPSKTVRPGKTYSTYAPYKPYQTPAKNYTDPYPANPQKPIVSSPPARTYPPVATVDPWAEIPLVRPYVFVTEPPFISGASKVVGGINPSPTATPVMTARPTFGISPTPSYSPIPTNDLRLSEQGVRSEPKDNGFNNTEKNSENDDAACHEYKYYFSSEDIRKIKELYYVKEDRYSVSISGLFFKYIEKYKVK